MLYICAENYSIQHVLLFNTAWHTCLMRRDSKAPKPLTANYTHDANYIYIYMHIWWVFVWNICSTHVLGTPCKVRARGQIKSSEICVWHDDQVASASGAKSRESGVMCWILMDWGASYMRIIKCAAVDVMWCARFIRLTAIKEVCQLMNLWGVSWRTGIVSNELDSSYIWHGMSEIISSFCNIIVNK